MALLTRYRHAVGPGGRPAGLAGMALCPRSLALGRQGSRDRGGGFFGATDFKQAVAIVQLAYVIGSAGNGLRGRRSPIRLRACGCDPSLPVTRGPEHRVGPITSRCGGRAVMPGIEAIIDCRGVLDLGKAPGHRRKGKRAAERQSAHGAKAAAAGRRGRCRSGSHGMSLLSWRGPGCRAARSARVARVWPRLTKVEDCFSIASIRAAYTPSAAPARLRGRRQGPAARW